ncbi:MAG: ABC-F family ATP-binding cassette domain-containing protein [Dethiobacteria bacterium]
MSLLILSEIGKSFGAQEVLENISLQLQAGDKAGLIGPNGAGKSTLLQIIAGLLEPDSGTVSLARGTRVGYLPQEPGREARGTLRSRLERPFRRLLELKEKIASLEQEIASRARSGAGDLDSLLARYGDFARRFEDEGGYLIESRISTVAAGLGFSPEELNRDTAHFSGGEKTRANLAELLLRDPDLLLLDEPTNYLDFEGLAWLEKYLAVSRSTMLIVSHDRYFLDRVVSQIFALEGRRLYSYRGNYSAYRDKHAAARESLERAYREQQKLIEQTGKLIRESKADRRSKRQARSRQKMLEKMDLLEKPPEEEKFHLNFDYAGRSGRQVVVFEELSKSFGNNILFSGLNLEIRWGDRVALVGPNGSGKSTLLKMVAGEEQPSRGRIRLGSAVSVVYFAQEQEQLDPGRTVLEEITANSHLDLKQARNHLGRYLFRGDDVFKKVASLSGGEKSRLALARLALSSGNCLLMDEPTSHLDLPALEELEAVLHGYPGTLIIVSHDRYFLKNLVNRVCELRRGRLEIFNGSFQEYLESKESETVPVGRSGSEGELDRKRQAQAEQRRRREHERRLRQLREEQQRLEEEIHAAEALVARHEKLLSNPEEYGDFNRLRELGDNLAAAKERLAELLQRWEEVSSQLEQLEADSQSHF